MNNHDEEKMTKRRWIVAAAYKQPQFKKSTKFKDTFRIFRIPDDDRQWEWAYGKKIKCGSYEWRELEMIGISKDGKQSPLPMTNFVNNRIREVIRKLYDEFKNDCLANRKDINVFKEDYYIILSVEEETPNAKL